MFLGKSRSTVEVKESTNVQSRFGDDRRREGIARQALLPAAHQDLALPLLQHRAQKMLHVLLLTPRNRIPPGALLASRTKARPNFINFIPQSSKELIRRLLMDEHSVHRSRKSTLRVEGGTSDETGVVGDELRRRGG